MKYPFLALKKKKMDSIQRRHPWVFSGALAGNTAELNDGDKVHLTDASGKVCVTGHFSPGSIAVRILAFAETAIDADFYFARLKNAYELRLSEGFVAAADTNAYRLAHAEGDGLPGLVIDVYNDVGVVQTHSAGMFRDYALIAGALQEVYGGRLKKIVHKPAEKQKRVAQVSEYDPTVDILEHGCRFRVNYETGQKTGFFLDQRENRQLLSAYAPGRKFLNAFSYSGGFSIYALKAGALKVHSLDSSARAIALVEENLKLNNLGNSPHRSILQDATDYLNSAEAADEGYDLIVLDPPAFAKRRSSRHQAVQAYKRLNARAIQLIQPGGILFTFSCSQVVTPELFYKTIAAAAIDAGRPVRILHHLHQPADHPVSIFHPEGEYLKGLVLSVA